MFEILKNETLVPNLHLLTVKARDVTEEIKPGQFVIIRSHDNSERIPLSVADWDKEEGSLKIIFMEVGASTKKMTLLKKGDFIPTVVGPLGKPTKIEQFGTVLCIGGCYGIGSIYPICKELKKKNNKIITILEGRSKNLIYWEEKFKPLCDDIIIITRDGSSGTKGHVKKIGEIIKQKGIVPNHIISNGCTFLVYKVSKEFSDYNIPIIVSLNTIMIDGTGMCGVCRVSINGKMKFACVDGPDFDGRYVDWEELSKRRKQYINEEAFLVHDSGCGGFIK